MTEAFIKFDRVTKTFAGVTALDEVSLEIAPGECHALMGENGAGKSTMGKILAGIHRPDSGVVHLGGSAVSFRSPAGALAAGVGMVHQELAFCADLSIAENLCMGRYPRRMGVLVNAAAMRAKAEALLGQIGVQLDVRRTMRSLSTAQEQLVQIAAAVGSAAKVLIFDEPTSSLSEPEAESLFALIDRLRKRGTTIIYVSHRLPEVFRLSDRISVLRDGKYVGTLENDRSDQSMESRLIQMMIGRPLEAYFPKHLEGTRGKVVLSVRNLSSPGQFRDVSFDVRAGEIVGFAGLVGSGRSEIARAIFGLDPRATGAVELEGERLALGNVRRAMARGVGLVPEDRKRQGLVLMMSGRANISMASLDRLSRLGLLDRAGERAEAAEYFAKLQVKAPSLGTPVAAMSGGNQQKVALAKWLARDSRLLIVDEPTRGVDVGAKAAIHALLDQLARQGMALMLISSELPEVLNLSTRILVMREGRLVADVPRHEATQENLLRRMAGI